MDQITCESFEDLKKRVSKFAKDNNFSVRTKYSNKAANSSTVIRVKFVCSCEGDCIELLLCLLRFLQGLLNPLWCMLMKK